MAERKVPIPVIAGKITKAKRKAGVYVLYELERVYDAKKSYNVPKRVTIGKVCPGDDKMMVPNENYQKYFPTAAIPEEHAEVDRSCCLKIGPHLVFDKILEEYRLKPMLSKHFGENTGLLTRTSPFRIRCLPKTRKSKATPRFPGSFHPSPRIRFLVSLMTGMRRETIEIASTFLTTRPTRICRRATSTTPSSATRK